MANDKAVDLFGYLLPLTWKGLEIPVSNLRTTLRQDIAKHEIPDVDGNFLEGMGRASLEHHATAHFRNAIAPALYPALFRQFLVKAAVGTDGELQHPELGRMQAKLHLADVKWDAKVRDGADVEVSWLEQFGLDLSALDPNATYAIDARLAYQSALSDMQQYVKSLAGKSAAFRAELDALKKKDGQINLDELAARLTAVPDMVTVATYRARGLVDATLYRVHNLVEAVERAGLGAREVSYKAIKERIEQAGRAMVKDSPDAARNIAVFETFADMTVAALAQTLSVKVNDLVLLNPRIVERPIVPRGTKVRYYG